MAAKKPQKGVAGKNTGGAARKAIRAAEAKGKTVKQIASSARRSPSVVSAIKSGEIKNPPSNVAKNIRKGTSKTKKK
jgi:orotate phosphoribosyltransferase